MYTRYEFAKHLRRTYDCSSAFPSQRNCPELVSELVKRMNENPLPDDDWTVENIVNTWDHPKSPVRNLLLVQYIDYKDTPVC